jgi:serine/threonine protein phosphatase 1
MHRGLPPDGPIFAIGDVHGCAEELELLVRKLPLTPDSTIVLLGDYIDRGPNSRGVIDFLLELRRKWTVVALRGNHELMLSEFLEAKDPILVGRYILNGGSATLQSYANAAGEYWIPTEHLEFFRSLRTSYEASHYFFVHAGVPNIPLSELDQEACEEEMLWTRAPFLRSQFAWEKIVVHGHSTVAEVEIARNRICVDTGCVYGGSLTAIELPSHRVYSVRRTSEVAPTVLGDGQGSRRAALRFRGAIPVQMNVGAETLTFETVDYSEIGLGIRSIGARNATTLKIGDSVSGFIGTGASRIPFQGRVVRFANGGDHEVIGLEINARDE